MKNKKFTKDDLKVGYVVKLKDGELRMVMQTTNDGTVIVKDNGWFISLNSYDYDLRYTRFALTKVDFTIVEVYGYHSCGGNACDISTENRELLWKREEAKKMTVEEIEKELGYKIEIVS